MVVKQAKIIFVNTNLQTSRKHFTIAHELGHHYLGHPLQNSAIIRDSDSVFGKQAGTGKRSRLLCNLLTGAEKSGQTKADNAVPGRSATRTAAAIAAISEWLFSGINGGYRIV